MCGIIGIISQSNVSIRLLEGLKRLEYRGYDSAGIATITDGGIDRRRAEGKLEKLIDVVNDHPLEGHIGIGHTRWATHGGVTKSNAHPMANETVAVVHNGIIENFASLKENLIKRGAVFTSDTDTEVVMHIVTFHMQEGLTPFKAVQKALSQIKGAFALAFLFKNHDNMLIAARRGSPLVLGMTESELFIGSDAIALASWVKTLCYLEEGDIATLTLNDTTPEIIISDADGEIVQRPLRQTNITVDAISKGAFTHYMLKEIFEQPLTISDTLQSLISIEDESFHSPLLALNKPFSKIRIIACGTSYYAGMVAKYWFEKLAHIHVDVEIASEFRYRTPVFDGQTLNLFITQSGETIDTMAALTLVKQNNETCLSIVNVSESSIARASDFVIHTMAGPEIGVASTKAFTAQLVVLAAICLKFAKERCTISETEWTQYFQSFAKLPGCISELLRNDGIYHQLATHLCQVHHALYLGRGVNFPIALEGALKLKEISYIHAEGYPAGELKHGPIALIDPKMPVIVLAPHDEWFEKTLSNVQEVLARGAKVIIFSDEKGTKQIIEQTKTMKCLEIVTLPESNILTAPILFTLPIQLLAYYTAHMKGTDVDQPRNLAKSVTVE
ncbi:MAG: glutamine--fructose-6-phosphate transaminase (isomerizing) [Candidatus Paracaedibacteraceae bacterium]|nr:glutamine--fructose-6-phosphate transaminase (isomerizing) [Candidatus Paracaedibacteraceae bacterium]